MFQFNIFPFFSFRCSHSPSMYCCNIFPPPSRINHCCTPGVLLGLLINSCLSSGVFLQCCMCGSVLEQQDIPGVWQETPRCPGECPALTVSGCGTGHHHLFGVLLHLPVMTIQQLINPFFPVPLQGLLVCSIGRILPRTCKEHP